MSSLQMFSKENMTSKISQKKDLLLDYQNSLENISLISYAKFLEPMTFLLAY